MSGHRIEQFHRRLRELGCTIQLRRGGHYRIDIPGGGIVFHASTPSDHRFEKNTLRDLRKAGLKL